MNKVKVSYKATNLPWCPEVPEHWEVKKLKYLADIQTGSSPKMQGTSIDYFENGSFNWFTPGDFDSSGELVASHRIVNEIAIKNKEIKVFPKFSTYLISIGATLGKAGYCINQASANQQINVISFFDSKIFPRYGYYLIIANNKYILHSADYTTLPILNQTKTANLLFPTPPLPEQQRIAEYLDKKTEQIDQLIANKEKLIECLKEERTAIINHAVTKGINSKAKLKPSGVEWVGEIPEDWEVKKLKYVAGIFGRIGFRGYQTSDMVNEGEGAITLSPSNIKEYKMEYNKCAYLSWEKYYESPEIIIENDDIVFVKTGSTFGKSGFVKNLPEKATINPQLLVFKNITINKSYFFNFLQTKFLRAQVDISVIGGTIPTISQEKIGNYVILVPSEMEQEKIVDYISKTTSHIDNTITQIAQEIELIKEYKTALINEVVTGKKIIIK